MEEICKSEEEETYEEELQHLALDEEQLSVKIDPMVVLTSKINENEDEFRIKLCTYCFDCLISELVDDEEPSIILTDDENAQYPIFVFWLSGDLELLRGSSGSFYYEDLEMIK